MKKTLIHTLYSILAAIPITAIIFAALDISLSWPLIGDMLFFVVLALPFIIAGQYFIISWEEKIVERRGAGDEGGNALFIVLLGVVLFAALSYTVSQSMRGSQSIDKEKATLSASAIINYATQLTNAVTMLSSLSNCSESELSFERPPFSATDTAYENPNAPGDHRCHVFHYSGGGAHHSDGWSYVANLALENVASPAPDLVAIHDVGTDAGMCGELNNLLDRNTSFTSIAQPAATLFKGSFPAGSPLACPPSLTVCASFCQLDAASGSHKFYHVLLPR